MNGSMLALLYLAGMVVPAFGLFVAVTIFEARQESANLRHMRRGKAVRHVR